MLTAYPENVGILAIEIYFPKRYVDQAELEKHDKVSTGKYTIGLGQTKMGFCDDREAVQNLVEKYKISYKDIGRLEVGTETIILMKLFAESNNTEVEGIDTTNACYGGTNALFNALNWIESSSWDGRYALVVAGDIAVYASGPARPTGGAGCVAMLLGKDAPIVFDRDKPNLTSEFPEVDGHLSNECYLKSLDLCYNRYLEKLITKENCENPSVKSFDYFLFHTPYCKLIQKSFGRLLYNDFIRKSDDPIFESVQKFKSMKSEETYKSKDLEKAFIGISKTEYENKVKPTLLAATEIGNMYCASLYGCLAAALSIIPTDELPIPEIQESLDILNRLKSRIEVTPEKFEEVMNLREKTHGKMDFQAVGDGSSLEDTFFKGTYYLDTIDSKWRRTYKPGGVVAGSLTAKLMSALGTIGSVIPFLQSVDTTSFSALSYITSSLTGAHGGFVIEDLTEDKGDEKQERRFNLNYIHYFINITYCSTQIRIIIINMKSLISENEHGFLC
ncbi:7337_t:CDS:2 [Diversispora eburnea]|uniref:Hydroxymethylglutaryl-CoA synthase n=1 Tax=Diversispora eburnea TaxID=1213867 RepID=A0A9N8UWW1_9GLOM|nr:7337_t:CDS:2 [Diversispora eburnea]